MTDPDLSAALAPWLQRWSLSNLDAAGPWLEGMRLVSQPADATLVRAGERSDTLYLLNKGLVRLYYITPDGRERNKAFFGSGQVTGPVSAALSSAPAPFSIHCLEPVEAVSFRLPDLLAAAEAHRGIARVYREMLADAFIRNEQREAMLLTCNAEQRYQWLLDHEPELPGRVAQFHIASYLGIDAVSLSRLKGKHRR